MGIFEFIRSKLEPLLGQPPSRGLKRELFFLRRQIARTERKIKDMYLDRLQEGTCPCCVDASYGGTSGRYSQLIAKNERRINRLAVLCKRLGVPGKT